MDKEAMNRRITQFTGSRQGTVNPSTTAPHTDEVTIRQLFQSMLENWDRGDATAYAEHFHEDADYIAFDGVNQKGRAAIIAAHQPLFDKWLKGSRLTGQIDSLHFLAPDVALGLAQLTERLGFRHDRLIFQNEKGRLLADAPVGGVTVRAL